MCAVAAMLLFLGSVLAATNQAQGILIYPDDGSSENETIPLRPLLISKDGMIEDEGSLEHTIRRQVTRILSYTDEKVRSESLFHYLFAIETKLSQVTREHGILSTENKCQSKSLWFVKARCAIEDIERRFKIARITLTNAEAEGVTDDFEFIRRLREKRWKIIFNKYKGHWQINEIITEIHSKNSDLKALDDFARDISVAYSLLSDDIQDKVFTKDMMTVLFVPSHLKENSKASSAVELLLSLFDLEPPGHAGKKRNANPSTREN